MLLAEDHTRAPHQELPIARKLVCTGYYSFSLRAAQIQELIYVKIQNLVSLLYSGHLLKVF